MAYWLPGESAAECRLALEAGDRLRYAVGIPDVPARSITEMLLEDDEPMGGAVSRSERKTTFTVHWIAVGEKPVLLDQVEGVTDNQPWLDREIVINAIRAGEGTLRFATRPKKPGDLVSAVVGDPRIIRVDRKPQTRPNLLVYLIDTLRADHLSCYGARNPTSPCLDELAADGFRFTNFYAVAPWTRPTTATLLTGYYPSWHGTGRWPARRRVSPPLHPVRPHLHVPCRW